MSKHKGKLNKKATAGVIQANVSQKQGLNKKGSVSKKNTSVKKSVKITKQFQPEPINRENISSNWKTFLQMAGAPAHPQQRAPRPKRGLARRGCSCPAPVWFDGVDPALLADREMCAFCLRLKEKEQKRGDQEAEAEKREEEEKETLRKARTPQPSHYLAMDCEMVGVGRDGVDSMLARVSIVNALGQPVYDKFVKPKERVTDYRTAVSGVRPADLAKGEVFETVQAEVAALLRGRVLVGHAVQNDLRVLLFNHPRRHTRDTASYKPFRKMFNGAIPSLKRLAQRLLAVDIQRGEHDSVQDARATMQVYQSHRREWEAGLAERQRARRAGQAPA